jgi:hypothetical protein
VSPKNALALSASFLTSTYGTKRQIIGVSVRFGDFRIAELFLIDLKVLLKPITNLGCLYKLTSSPKSMESRSRLSHGIEALNVCKRLRDRFIQNIRCFGSICKIAIPPPYQHKRTVPNGCFFNSPVHECQGYLRAEVFMIELYSGTTNALSSAHLTFFVSIFST